MFFNWQNPVDGGWLCRNCSYLIINNNLEECSECKTVIIWYG